MAMAISPPDPKMLLFFELRSEKNYTEMKKVNRTANSDMLFNIIPGLLHLTTPMYIVEDEN